MKDCEADAEMGLDVQRCVAHLREMRMELGRLGDCQT